VRVEKIWKEVLHKESEHRNETAGPPGFQMNLANHCGTSGLLRLQHSHNRIEIVTEKEHKQAPNARRSLKGMNPNSFEVLAIKHLAKKPGHKWDLPEVSSHDYGWMQGDFVRAATMSPAKTHTGGFGGASGQAAGASRGSASLLMEPASLLQALSLRRPWASPLTPPVLPDHQCLPEALSRLWRMITSCGEFSLRQTYPQDHDLRRTRE
jgi:hypothetical protein